MQIKNSKTKEVKDVDEKGWEAIQKNPLVNNWSVVAKTKTPPEVAELAAKKEQATAKEESPKNTSK